MGFLQTFKRRFCPGRELSQVQTLTGNTATYTAFSGGAYDNDIYRGAVDAIARNAAKLKGAHIVTGADNQAKAGDKSLDRLLQIQPNPYMTAYDLIYKLCTHYYLNNNDEVIKGLLDGAAEYIAITTGLIPLDQAASPLAKTATKFLLSLWYDPTQADTDRLQRSIDNLLKAVTHVG